MPEVDEIVAAAQAAAGAVVVGIRQRASEAASVWDVPASGMLFLPGDKVTISGTSSADGVYQVVEGDEPDTVWVNPCMSRQLKMKRAEDDGMKEQT